ncbi:MAG: cation transporter, partial [Candidatus Sedimenticola endophacoides]
RWPKSILLTLAITFAAALAAALGGAVKLDFFASDPIRLFYVNIEMPADTPLDITLEKVLEVERKVRTGVRPGEVRETLAYAGQMFTETAPSFGDHYGQVLVSLNPRSEGLREVDAMIEGLRARIEATPGPLKLSFLRRASGPPTDRPIQIKVRGDETAGIRRAVADLKSIMRRDPAIRDITDDDSRGQMALSARIDHDAARRAGIDPGELARTLALLVDGEIVARMQHRGEELELRVRAKPRRLDTPLALGEFTLPLADGGPIPLKELLEFDAAPSLGNIRHYNFRRTITVEADLDKTRTDTVAANAAILAEWEKIRPRYPGIDLDFTGELDDIQESIDAILVLSLFGVGLMYLILGTQFRSYFQPLMILTTVPMAFTGVVAGLLITDNPLSLFTLYGVVALAGIAVNAAIVLISAANARLEQGMSVLHATVYAARRRVIPILITSLTTIAGLFSLATGLGGRSLLWGPVATAIVWGLLVSTLLTLFVIPLLYRLSMDSRLAGRHKVPDPGEISGPGTL